MPSASRPGASRGSPARSISSDSESPCPHPHPRSRNPARVRAAPLPLPVPPHRRRWRPCCKALASASRIFFRSTMALHWRRCPAPCIKRSRTFAARRQPGARSWAQCPCTSRIRRTAIVSISSPRCRAHRHPSHTSRAERILPAAAAPLADVGAERQMARRLMTPLAEPEWTAHAPTRGKGVAAAPHHGAAVNQARDAVMRQKEHMGEVGKDATTQYLAGERPAKIRVDRVNSATLYKRLTAGAHEVVPTDLAPRIVEMPPISAHRWLTRRPTCAPAPH